MAGKKMYVVTGGLWWHYNDRGWFADIPRGAKFKTMATFICCKTYRHALAQYKRLRKKDRQIDLCHKGKSKVIKYD